MNREDLFEAIGEIDGRSVRRAEKFRASGKPAWIRWAALAACIALLVGAFAVVPRLKKGGSAEETEKEKDHSRGGKHGRRLDPQGKPGKGSEPAHPGKQEANHRGQRSRKERHETGNGQE